MMMWNVKWSREAERHECKRPSVEIPETTEQVRAHRSPCYRPGGAHRPGGARQSGCCAVGSGPTGKLRLRVWEVLGYKALYQ